MFWAPLAATWLMMAVEGPFLAAVIARLKDPTPNLAAWGVAFAVAILVEAPVIMIMSASTALARDRISFLKLRSFIYALSAALTIIMAVLVFTPAFGIVAERLIGLPKNVAVLTQGSLVIFLPWPGAIGLRRFYQGLLIRNNQTRRVAYGTVARVFTMGSTAVVLYLVFDKLPGAYVGAGACSAGVTFEAIASWFMARSAVRKLLIEKYNPSSGREQLTYRGIIRFYFPLAMTSMLSLAMHPMVTFFVGHSRYSLESLAVIPVINGFSFLFRAIGLSFHEVSIALMGDNNKHYPELKRFAVGLALLATIPMVVIAFTPLLDIWYRTVGGLSPELAAFTVIPTRILSIIPALGVMISFQRAILVNQSHTKPVTWATVIEVSIMIVVLVLAIDVADMIGATAAAIALLVGRISGNLYSIVPCMKILRKRG